MSAQVLSMGSSVKFQRVLATDVADAY